MPDVVFDELAPQLTEAELRVLLYIIRRTFGFKKNADTISLKQMAEGITTREGHILDRGTGLSKSATARGVKGLIENGVIRAVRKRSKERGDEATTYALRFQEDPVSSKETGGVPPKEHGGVLLENTQYTEVQNTELQTSNIRTAKPIEIRKGNREPVVQERPARRTTQFVSLKDVMQRKTVSLDEVPVVPDEARDAITAYITDFAQEFSDRAPVQSSITRALNLYSRSHLSLSTFLQRLFDARAITRESVSARQQQVRRPQKRMAYFFACLEDRLHMSKQAHPKSASFKSADQSSAVTVHTSPPR